MPKGPQGQKRPQGEVQAAVMVGKIATGQIKEPQTRRMATIRYADARNSRSLNRAFPKQTEVKPNA